MKYIVADFHVTCPPALLQVARDLIADAAGEAGFESFEDTDDGLKGYVQRDLFDRDVLNYNIATIPLEELKVDIDVADAEDKDWNQEWEHAGFDPINIDDRVIILDDRREEKPEDGQAAPVSGLSAPASGQPLSIRIHARQAFGTGTHETTQMVIRMLLSLEPEGRRVLDCGCGTGILGIAASRLGAKAVTGYDIDEWSVDNARQNAALNGVENLEVLHGDATVLSHVSGLFDVVMANINRNILLADMPAFKDVMASGASLILSGFYEDDIAPLLARAEDLGLHEAARLANGDWRCLRLEA